MIKKVSYEYAKTNGFNDDILRQFKEPENDEGDGEIIEDTVQDLADANIGSFTGVEGKSCFKGIAKKYPQVKVRALLYVSDNAVICPDMLISSIAQGEEIERLAEKSGGGLRFDEGGLHFGSKKSKPEWAYFETE